MGLASERVQFQRAGDETTCGQTCRKNNRFLVFIQRMGSKVGQPGHTELQILRFIFTEGFTQVSIEAILQQWQFLYGYVISVVSQPGSTVIVSIKHYRGKFREWQYLNCFAGCVTFPP